MPEPNDTRLVHEHFANAGRVKPFAGGQFLGSEDGLVGRSGILWCVHALRIGSMNPAAIVRDSAAPCGRSAVRLKLDVAFQDAGKVITEALRSFSSGLGTAGNLQKPAPRDPGFPRNGVPGEMASLLSFFRRVSAFGAATEGSTLSFP